MIVHDLRRAYLGARIARGWMFMAFAPGGRTATTHISATREEIERLLEALADTQAILMTAVTR